MTAANFGSARPAGRAWNITLWIGQVALASLYGMAAYMHWMMSPAEMAQMGLVWTIMAPIAFIRFIGFMEFLGVLGLILPSLTRIQPQLTVWAAAGLLAIQLLAIPLHILRGEITVVSFNLIYVALAVFVLWGRARKAPIVAG